MKIVSKNIYFYLFLIFGIFVVFHKYFFSGGDSLPGTLVDARFINYILEHIYCWMFNIGNHKELFSPPFYYPLKDTLFYSDTLLSIYPVYMVFRLFIDVYSSYTWTVISCFFLNYISFYLLLKHFGYKNFWSAFGAYMYAFSLLNTINLIHLQMLTQFFSVFSILCLLNVREDNSNIKNSFLITLSAFLVVCQFYASYYLGFFLFLGFLFYTVISLFDKNSKKVFYKFLQQYKVSIILSCIILLLFLLPLGFKYLSLGEIRNYKDCLDALLIYKSFFNSNSIIWGNFILEPYRYRDIYVSNFGLFTLILGFIGLFKFNKKYFLLTFIVYLSLFNINDLSLIYFWYHIPGGTGIRFWYRLLYLMLPFITIGVVYFLSNINSKKLCLLLSIILFMEQIPIISYFVWSKKIEVWKMQYYSRKIPTICNVIEINGVEGHRTFLYRWIDSMWFAHYRGVYSKSGYSGILKFNIPSSDVPSYCQYHQAELRGEPKVLYE